MLDESSSLLHCKGELFNFKSKKRFLDEERKEMNLSEQPTGMEIKGHQLDMLDASKQELNELDNNAELEVVMGGGFIRFFHLAATCACPPPK